MSEQGSELGLPILHGDRLVGKVAATADRKSGTLGVHAIHEDVAFTRAMTQAVHNELQELASWLELTATGRPAHGPGRPCTTRNRAVFSDLERVVRRPAEDWNRAMSLPACRVYHLAGVRRSPDEGAACGSS